MTYSMSKSLAGERAEAALSLLILGRAECVDPAELERLNKAITAAHEVLEPRNELKESP